MSELLLALSEAAKEGEPKLHLLESSLNGINLGIARLDSRRIAK